MLKTIKTIIYTFLVITFLTSFLTLIGLFYLWFFSDKADLPHLKILMIAVILEVVSMMLLLAKKGMKYLPDVLVNKNSKETLKFMEEFITKGTSATIVSNRLSWLSTSDELISILKNKIDSGLKIEIITKDEVSQGLKNTLNRACFYLTNEEISPEARFTLINGERSGSEKLAISKGIHPEHEITVFDTNSGPQIIGMAKDIIRKSKELSNHKKMVRGSRN